MPCASSCILVCTSGDALERWNFKLHLQAFVCSIMCNLKCRSAVRCLAGFCCSRANICVNHELYSCCVYVCVNIRSQQQLARGWAMPPSSKPQKYRRSCRSLHAVTFASCFSADGRTLCSVRELFHFAYQCTPRLAWRSLQLDLESTPNHAGQYCQPSRLPSRPRAVLIMFRHLAV
jgi:hypothetical protein